METSGVRAMVILVLVLGAFALTGCGGLGQDKELILANMGWDENVAISFLTKVLLGEDLDYESVEVSTEEDLDTTFHIG